MVSGTIWDAASGLALRTPLSGAESVLPACTAESAGPLEVGADPSVSFSDLCQLEFGVDCVEHRSMSFPSRVGTWMGVG